MSQTHESHERIAELLTAFRQVRDEPQKYRNGGHFVRPASEEKIVELLKAKQDFDFQETTLRELAAILRKQGIPVQLDIKSLSDSGNSPESPVNFHAKHVRLDNALKLMLQEHDFSFLIDHEVLLITSDAKSKEHVVTRLYPVADLIPESSINSPEEIAAYEKLIDVITSTVFPTAWDHAGGTGSIKPFPLLKIFVCSQTQDAHEEISKLLKMIRVHRGANVGSADADRKTKDEPVTRVYHLSPEHADAAGDYLAVIQKLVDPKIWTAGENYLGKVPGAIIARCSPATNERIRRLLIELEALPPPPGTAKGTGLGGGKSVPVVGFSGAF